MIMKRNAVIFLGLFIALVSGCKKDSDKPDPNVAYGTTLTGGNEVPGNTSTATGSVSGTFNKNTKVLQLTITYNGLSPTAGHIHEAAAGTNGSVVFPFSSVASSPFSFISAPLDAAQEANLEAGLYYVNLHTTAYPGGEIRGQLLKQ